MGSCFDVKIITVLYCIMMYCKTVQCTELYHIVTNGTPSVFCFNKIWFPITFQFLIYPLAKQNMYNMIVQWARHVKIWLITWTYCHNQVDALRPHSFFVLLLLPGVHLPTDLLTDLLPLGLLLVVRLDLQGPTYTRKLYFKKVVFRY